MLGLVDSHCHLDAAEFDADRDELIQAAWSAGVGAMVVPAVARAHFSTVQRLCATTPGCVAAYGIHPLYVSQAAEGDLAILETFLARQPCVAVGEIGLDFFVQGDDRARQEWFFVEQLKLARRFELPVLLHVRRAVDDVLKHVRRIKVRGGIAHAFNGSRQQAEALMQLGFKLGFGGAMTWPRARRIRALAASLPLSALVLETDAPDMPPVWLGIGERNRPDQLPRMAQALAAIRGVSVAEIIDTTSANVLATLPRMPQLFTRPHVIL